MALKLHKNKAEVFAPAPTTSNSKPSTMILSSAVTELKAINNQVKALNAEQKRLKAEIAKEARGKFITHNLGRSEGDVDKTISVSDIEGNEASVSFASPKPLTDIAHVNLLKEYLQDAYEDYTTQSREWTIHENLLPSDAVRELEPILVKWGVSSKTIVIPSEALRGLPFETAEDQAFIDGKLDWRNARVRA